MNTYELIYLIPSVITEEHVLDAQKAVEDILMKEKAEVIHHKILVRRKLAYKIRKVDHAYYIVLYFKGDTESIPHIVRGVFLIQDVIRSRVLLCDNFEEQKEYFIDGKRKDEPPKEEAATKVEAIKSSPESLPVMRPFKPVLRPAQSAQSVDQSDAKDEAEKKETKKPSLEELDKKLESILEGEIDF